jgi:hypothetical protein
MRVVVFCVANNFVYFSMISAVLILLLFASDSTLTVVVESSQKLFESAICCSSAPDGMVYVTDQKKNTVHQVSSTNSIIRTVGGKGWGNTEFDLPFDVASSFLLDLFVVDENNFRVQRFDKQFNFLRTYDESSIPQLIGRFRPRACTFSSFGDLFVIEQDGNRIVKISQRGLFEREFGTYKEGKGALVDPQDIAVTSTDDIVVLDKNAVVLFDRFGNYLRRISLPEKIEWKTISVTDNILCVVSPIKIILINMLSRDERSVVPQSFIGAIINEPFSDAVIQNSTLVVLTPTTIYRCNFP